MATRLRIFRRRDAQERAEERTLTAQDLPPVMLKPVPGGASVTPGNALAIADAYTCVRALADAAASLPLHVYRRTRDGRERVEGRTAELLRRPAPATTQANLVGQLVAQLNLHGNAYLGKFRNSERVIDQLALLDPQRVTPELKAGRPVYTVTGPKGERSVHGPDDIVHVRALSTDGLVGLSPVTQCRVALGLSSSPQQSAKTYTENGSKPSGILTSPHGGSQALEQVSKRRRTAAARRSSRSRSNGRRGTRASATSTG